MADSSEPGAGQDLAAGPAADDSAPAAASGTGSEDTQSAAATAGAEESAPGGEATAPGGEGTAGAAASRDTAGGDGDGAGVSDAADPATGRDDVAAAAAADDAAPAAAAPATADAASAATPSTAPAAGEGRESGDAAQPLVEARAAPGETEESAPAAAPGETPGADGSTAPDALAAAGSEGEAAGGGDAGDAVAPPSFDTLRIARDGRAVIAGRAEPGALVTVRSGPNEIGSVTADRRGEWVLLPDRPIPPGDHVFSAIETLPDGRQVESEQVVVLSVPDPASGEDADRALAVLMPRDGAGKSTVLQQPPPAEEEPVDQAPPSEEEPVELARPDEDDTPPDDQAGAADASPDDRAGAETDPAAAAAADAAAGETAPAVTSAEASGGEDDGTLAVDTVDYDDEGDMVIAGTAEPDADLQVYLDDEHVGTVESDEQGEWELDPGEEVEPGSHVLRVDQVDPAGVVLARIETPLVRAQPQLLTFGDAIVVVQPGNSLWRIARRTLGGGVHFTVIYEANRNQIADPALIYPGQIFTVPERD